MRKLSNHTRPRACLTLALLGLMSGLALPGYSLSRNLLFGQPVARSLINVNFLEWSAPANLGPRATPNEEEESWQAISTGLASLDVRALAIDPVTAATIYVGSRAGVSKSTDGGASWSQSGLPGSVIVALAIDFASPNTLYAGTFDLNGVLKSTDGGAQWSTTGLTGTAVNVLAIDPLNPSILYAATSGFCCWPSHPNRFRGLFKSPDGGVSWLAINNGLADLIGTQSSIAALVIHPGNPNIVYAATAGSGAFKSIDGGAHWSSFSYGLTNLDIRALALDPGNPNTLYAATAGGVFKISDLVMPQAGTVTSVSAASYRSIGLASESIAASFGTALATASTGANTLPLPTELAGTTVKVKDSAGTERFAPLFFVSPTQVNYLIPSGTTMGMATMTITSGDGAVSNGVAQIKAVAPSLFTANGNGEGVAAALALRFKADGSQSYEEVAQFDAAQNKLVSRPLDLGPESDQVFLLLFGTGIRHRSLLSAVITTIGGADAEVNFAEAQGDVVGMDQVNVLLPRSLVGRGEVELLLTVEARMANPVRISIK